MRQYDPKLIRACSRSKGVNTPRNEWNRRLRTKTARSNKHQGQVHPNVKGKIKTSPAWRERENGGICSHHSHDARGKMVQEKESGKPTTVLRADTISEAAKQRGESFTKVEPGDTQAVSKPKIKK